MYKRQDDALSPHHVSLPRIAFVLRDTSAVYKSCRAAVPRRAAASLNTYNHCHWRSDSHLISRSCVVVYLRLIRMYCPLSAVTLVYCLVLWTKKSHTVSFIARTLRFVDIEHFPTVLRREVSFLFSFRRRGRLRLQTPVECYSAKLMGLGCHIEMNSNRSLYWG